VEGNVRGGREGQGLVKNTRAFKRVERRGQNKRMGGGLSYPRKILKECAQALKALQRNCFWDKGEKKVCFMNWPKGERVTEKARVTQVQGLQMGK